jgi:hypothetical protein
LFAQHPAGLLVGGLLGILGGLDLVVDVAGRAAGDRAAEVGHGLVEHLVGHLADLGNQDGLTGRDVLADRIERDVGVHVAQGGAGGATEHAGVAAQEHAERAAEDADEHTEQAAGGEEEPGGVVGALGHPDRPVRAAFEQDRRANLEAAVGADILERAERLVGLALVGEADEHHVVVHGYLLALLGLALLGPAKPA